MTALMGWSGDASADYTQESIMIPVVRPVSVTATFSDDADDLGTTWMPKGTVDPGSGTGVMRLDIGAGDQRFYRVRVSNSPDGLELQPGTASSY